MPVEPWLRLREGLEAEQGEGYSRLWPQGHGPPPDLVWSQDKDGQLPSWRWPPSGPFLACGHSACAWDVPVVSSPRLALGSLSPRVCSCPCCDGPGLGHMSSCVQGCWGGRGRRSEEWTRAAETAGPLPPLSGKRRRGQESGHRAGPSSPCPATPLTVQRCGGAGGDHASHPLEQAGCERDPGAERSGQEECVGTHGRPSSPRTFAASQQMWIQSGLYLLLGSLSFPS